MVTHGLKYVGVVNIPMSQQGRCRNWIVTNSYALVGHKWPRERAQIPGLKNQTQGVSFNYTLCSDDDSDANTELCTNSLLWFFDNWLHDSQKFLYCLEVTMGLCGGGTLCSEWCYSCVHLSAAAPTKLQCAAEVEAVPIGELESSECGS